MEIEREDRRAIAVLSLATLALVFEYHHRYFGVLSAPFDFFEWHLATILLLLVVPVLVATRGLGFSLRELGFGRGEPSRWLRPAAGLGCAMLVVVVVASRLPAFQAYYPLFRYARDHPASLPLSILGFGAYLFAWEFLFRGLLIGGLRGRFGRSAIVVQAVPFTLVHFGKPELEVFGSFFIGLALGWLAYRGRTFVPGFVLHWLWFAALETLVVVWR